MWILENQHSIMYIEPVITCWSEKQCDVQAQRVQIEFWDRTMLIRTKNIKESYSYWNKLSNKLRNDSTGVQI